MKIRQNRRLLGLMLAPFALFTACVGLTPEEQAEYRELQEEVRRIQIEEIEPRRGELQKVLEGKFVVDVEQLQAQINQVRNEKLEPLNEELVTLKSSDPVLAAPGTKIELEELNRRLEELEALHAGMKAEIEQQRQQLIAAKEAAASEPQEQIDALELEIKSLVEELEELGFNTDIRALEIDEQLAALREELEDADEGSEAAQEITAAIAELEEEWELLHDAEASAKADLEASIDAKENEIHELRAEIERRHGALIDQFENMILGLEISAHDIAEEKEDVIRRIHELELSAPEELEKTISDLEELIEKIVTTELRPLIERLEEARQGGDSGGATVSRERLVAELEEWLAKIAQLRARMSELSAKSFQSLINGLDLGALGSLG